MRKKAVVRSVVAAMAVFLCACPERSAIWLADGTEPGQPVFGVGESRGGKPLDSLPVVGVGRCEDFDGTGTTALWLLVRVSDGAIPHEVRFGEAPPGYRVDEGPTRLEPGCYVARIVGTGRLRFVVREDGISSEAPDG